MLKQAKIKNDNQKLILASVLLFLALSFAMLLNGIINNSQAKWAIVPDIRLVGEYKIGDGEWKPIVEGEHIPATKGDVMLKGVLEIYDPETKDVWGIVAKGSLMYFTFNHINLLYTENKQIIDIYDTENPTLGEDACGDTCFVVEYKGEDGNFEATIRNNHSFGNESAIDELLSSMKLYASDYSEKTALRSGQNERLIAIIIIIFGFIVLGIAIFSVLIYTGIFSTALPVGLLIISAGVFFLVTSKAFYVWFDTVIVNTMMTGISLMTYFLFAIVLMKGLFSDKKKRLANIITLLYGVFISTLVAVSLFSKIYFYDMIGVWAVGAVVVSVIFIVLALLSVKKATITQKPLLIFSVVGLVLF